MASISIQPMDISGSKSELRERWRVWLRGFTSFAERKADLQNAARKKSELLYRAGSGVQDIFENLTAFPAPEVQDDVLYLQTVRTLNVYFRVQENAAYVRHVLRQLRQEPGDVDLFVLRLRKQARHCGGTWIRRERSVVGEGFFVEITDQAVWGAKYTACCSGTYLITSKMSHIATCITLMSSKSTWRFVALAVPDHVHVTLSSLSFGNIARLMPCRFPRSHLFFQPGVKRVQNVIKKRIGQLVVRVIVRRVVEWKEDENVEGSVLVMLNVIPDQGTSKLIKLNMTVEMSLMHSLLTLMERVPVRIMWLRSGLITQSQPCLLTRVPSQLCLVRGSLTTLRRVALKQNCNPKKGTCKCMGMVVYQLWVNLRRVLSVMEGKL